MKCCMTLMITQKWRILYNNKITEVNKESKDVETLLRMCAFDYYIKGTDNQFELTGYKGKISTLLDSFSERAREFSDNQIEGYRLKLLEFIDSIEKVSGKNKGVALASFFVAWNRLKEKPFITRENMMRLLEVMHIRRRTIVEPRQDLK